MVETVPGTCWYLDRVLCVSKSTAPSGAALKIVKAKVTLRNRN